MSLLSDILKEDATFNKCRTCSNQGWVKIVNEYLEGRIDGSIGPVPISDLQRKMADPEVAERLGIEPYPYSVNGLYNHIGKCCRELWSRVGNQEAGD